MKTTNFYCKFLFAVELLIISTAQGSAQTSEFSYQGKLVDTGTQSATYDFEFWLNGARSAAVTRFG